MSTEAQVERLLSGAGGSSTTKAVAALEAAKQEIGRMLNATRSSMYDLCINIEKAKNRAEVKAAFTAFNMVIRILLEAAPGVEHNTLVKESLSSFKLSPRLEEALRSVSSVSAALSQWKEAVATDLAETMRAQAARAVLYDEKDDEMLLRLLPDPSPPPAVGQIPIDDESQNQGKLTRKRVFSAIEQSPVIPEESSIPALASLSRMQELVDNGCITKKQSLLTREKLRSALKDPRGLLKRVSSSTSALEHAKKMEILKCAGVVFGKNKKGQGKTPFADRLQTARTRLELGLGGHALSDTLLFGAKVLSTPGVLTQKNISDVENNIVGGKTT